MKLDRNINGDGRGKYGLIKSRMLHPDELAKLGPAAAANIVASISVLEQAGILDWGDTVDTEFFVIRLRDICAAPALRGYAIAAHDHDAEYAEDVFSMTNRAGIYHPNPKVPD